MIYLKEGQNQIYTASPQPGEYQRRGNPGILKWGEETAITIVMILNLLMNIINIIIIMMLMLMIIIYTASPNPGEYQRRGNPGAFLMEEETAT